MPLLGADQFQSILDAYRLCWIGGRFGGHKTAVAVALAEPYLKRGYRLVTNLACVWADDLSTLGWIEQDAGNLGVQKSLKVVAILDEGGLEVKHTAQVEAMTAYARKMDCIYMYPSFFPPSLAARVVYLQPLFSFKVIGLPLIWYKWVVNLGGFREEGTFGWWNPKEVYGLYSSNNPGAALDEIINWFVAKTYEYRASFGLTGDWKSKSTDEVSGVAIVNHLSEVADQLGAAATEISVSSRERKGHRR